MKPATQLPAPRCTTCNGEGRVRVTGPWAAIWPECETCKGTGLSAPTQLPAVATAATPVWIPVETAMPKELVQVWAAMTGWNGKRFVGTAYHTGGVREWYTDTEDGQRVIDWAEVTHWQEMVTPSLPEAAYDRNQATIAQLTKALGAAHHLLMQLPSNSAADEADIRKVLREAESVLKATGSETK